MAAILAVQQGMVLAHDGKAFRSWLRDNRDPIDHEEGLSGADLETAVFTIAALDPFASDPKSQLVRVVN